MSETKNTTKTFTLDGATYRQTEKGYCTRDGRRISAKAFAEAERAHEAEMVAEIDANVEAAKGIAAGHVVLTVDPDAPMVEAELHCGFAEVEVEIPETEGDTEQAYAEEEVPAARPEFEIPGVKKDQASVGHVNGHEYVHDWFGKRYFRDGEEISKFEYESEVYGKSEERAPKSAEKAPKVKRARKPKDVAGTFETSEGTVTLTAKQLDFLREVAELSEDSLLGSFVTGCWCDILTDAIGGQFMGRPMTVGAMISTICEKGLGERHKEDRSSVGARTRKVTKFSLTPKGREVWEALGL